MWFGDKRGLDLFAPPRYSSLLSSGRSAAWLAHLFWEQGVVSSNPTAPTRFNTPADSVRHKVERP